MRTGVIVGIPVNTQPDVARDIIEHLRGTFGGAVDFAVIAGGSSVAFTYDDDPACYEAQ